jgi:hypothetical protein
MKNILVTIPFLIFASAANAQITQTGGKYLFVAKYKQGQSTNVIMTVMSTVPSAKPTNLTIKAKSKVISVAKDGSAVIEFDTPAFGGRPASKQRASVDKFGRPKGNTMGNFSGNFSSPTYPIKVGESWSGDVNLSAGQGAPPIPLKAKYQFKSIKTVSGVKVAVISVGIDVSSLFNMKGTGEMMIRFDDGQLFESNLNMGMQAPDPKTKKNVLIKMVVNIRNRR